MKFTFNTACLFFNINRISVNNFRLDLPICMDLLGWNMHLSKINNYLSDLIIFYKKVYCFLRSIAPIKF